MKSKLIYDGPQRTFVVVLDTGDEVTKCLLHFAREQRLSAAEFTGLGALRDVALGYFDWQKKDYERIPIDEQVEVLNLTGNVALPTASPGFIRMSWSARRMAPRTAGICLRRTSGRRSRLW
jgi:uncharacterized protein